MLNLKYPVLNAPPVVSGALPFSNNSSSPLDHSNSSLPKILNAHPRNGSFKQRKPKILNEKLNNQGAVNGEKATNESKKSKLNVDLYEFLQDSWRADDSKRKDTNS